jgi:hypothetical protein
MYLKELETFRIYYSQTIHPELMRMERQRLRLLGLLAFSAFLLVGAFVIELYLNLLILTLALSIPITFYIAYLVYRVQQFRRTFKPNVVNLILHFIDEQPNYGQLAYDPRKFLTKDLFKQSKIFSTPAHYYAGEDYINGRVGEMPFEMCELSVREIARTDNKLEVIFEGVFLYAVFNEEAEGHMVIWPRKMRKYLSRSIKAFTWEGGENVDHEILNERFRERFLVYATEDTHVVGILSEPMQDSILDYVDRTGKDIYLAFHDREIYAAVTEQKDLLEPFIFQSNLNFELVKEFYEDISLILRVVQDFDQTH